jgi:hypothetical protein
MRLMTEDVDQELRVKQEQGLLKRQQNSHIHGRYLGKKAKL